MVLEGAIDDAGCLEAGQKSAAVRKVKPTQSPGSDDDALLPTFHKRAPKGENGTAEGGDQSRNPLDFLFTTCVRSHCHPDLEEEELETHDDEGGSPRDRDETYVTRTFHWKPEDFPLEIATYMQCEEPWSPDVILRQNVVARPQAGKMRSCRVKQLSADNLPAAEMVEDDCQKEAETLTAPTMPNASSSSDSLCGDLAGEEAVDAADFVDGHEDDWIPDWSHLQPPPPPSPPPTPLVTPGSTPEELEVDVGRSCETAGPTARIPATWTPLDAKPDPGSSSAPTHAQMEAEVQLLREQVKALRHENELLRSAPPASAIPGQPAPDVSVT